ncbi:MAG: M56 family metallopeptidase [bacterium]|nr:M56 family metallopeptidase [bacterium]
MFDVYALSWATLTWLAEAVLHGTVLAVVTLLVCLPLRRSRRSAWEAALWLIVLIKFLVPVGPQSSLSLANAVERIAGQSPTQNGDHFERGQTAAIRKAAFADRYDAADLPAPVAPTVADGLNARLSPGSSVLPQTRSRIWTPLIAGLYLVAAALLVGLRVRAYRKLLFRCRTLQPAGTPTRMLVGKVCRRLGMRRAPSVRVDDEFSAPFVLGLFRPGLVVPRYLLGQPAELETVLVHEMAHLRRCDLLVHHLQGLAATLLFFWPVVAWVNRRLDLARECACDAWALHHGRLSAGQYARCLLQTAQAAHAHRHLNRSAAWLARPPAGLAGNCNSIERRIDMILGSTPSVPAATRSAPKPALAAFLAVWCGFALTGATGADRSADRDRSPWPATEEAVKQHATELYDLVAERATGDLDGDGRLAYLEKDAYLIALAMQAPGRFMEEFPYADRDRNDVLDLSEIHDALRGITLIAYADRRPDAAPGARLDLEFYHLALNVQQWLLDNVATEPSLADLANARAISSQSFDPRSDHVRKLNHGAPDQHAGRAKLPRTAHARFQELEGQIAAIDAKLAAQPNARQAETLKTMRNKLESLLARLQAD